LRWENPPEGAKNLQECSRNTGEHNTQLGCTGIHKILEVMHKGLAQFKETERKREAEGRKEGARAAHRGGKERGTRMPWDRRWSPERGRSPASAGNRQRQRDGSGEMSLWLGLGLEAFF
jgi:hypothetical protein